MKNNKFVVIFIGDTPLLYSCVLFSHKHFGKIYLMTKNKRITKNLPKEIVKINSLKSINLKKINFIFSVMNEKILPKKVLNFRNIIKINFHDGPLPKYAGLYSSTWSILNKEKFHGVTWHEMNDIIDGGDIYLKKKFPIKKDDTAENVDMKSNFCGFQLFKKLLKSISKSKLKKKKQNLQLRSYYGLKDRNKIPNNGIINFRHPINQILRISRALKFSPNKKNKLCRLRILTSKGMIFLKELRIIKVVKHKIYGIEDLIKVSNNAFFLKKDGKIFELTISSQKKIKSFYLKFI